MKKIILLLLLTVLIVSGCVHTLTQEEIQDISKNDSKKVIDAYYQYMDAETLNDDVFNINKQIPLTTGKFQELLISEKQLSEAILQLSQFYSKCIVNSSENVCSNFKKDLDKYQIKYYKYEIKNINPIELTENKTVWEIERRREFKVLDDNIKVDFKIVKYVLIKKDENWFIYDIISDDGNSTIENVDLSIEENNNLILNLKTLEEMYLESALKASNDKCYYLKFNEKLTASELEIEENICYRSKYNDLAVTNEDHTICDEIASNPYWVGMCYASVVAKTNDISVCNNMINEAYIAKGYNEPSNSKDLCYYYS